MNELITKDGLKKIGFQLSNEQPLEERTSYSYDVFTVFLKEDKPESPIISVYEKLSDGDIPFPGAFTLKDLRDLMFFYYGENEYTERFGHLPIEIVDETPKQHTKEEQFSPDGLQEVRDEIENAVLNWDNDDTDVLVGGIMSVIQIVFDPENQPNQYGIEPFKTIDE